mmetsp:Transcript_29027/g.42828  ORF Transcript_29027/g.42828 Transcript_29027/m.42828 type:complete len:174 (-) Transcript_29027:429-950(-)|eukprot:CAMPEP_0194228476 /NCGR_PEP_ID=MMETSP0156-20130528/43393_1 /TAXON_ID=33649 /ORGANISM="Thalassionema nitzschioides, Strain L26-B" /LENGTH=173 /DNA_ID=CAMNT_0038960991 /DNA_START=165 /DNA_END=686 /DNA_ORIENTATION=+
MSYCRDDNDHTSSTGFSLNSQLSILQRVRSLGKVRPASSPSLSTLHQQHLVDEPSPNADFEFEEENTESPSMEELLVPLSDTTLEKKSKGMKKSVSFSTFNSIERIPSRNDLLATCDKGNLWFGKQDIGQFVHEELSRRSYLGISSTKALDPSVPEDFDFHEGDENEEIGLSF